MKKSIYLFLSVALLISGCTSGEKQDTTENPTAPSPTSAPTSAPIPTSSSSSSINQNTEYDPEEPINEPEELDVNPLETIYSDYNPENSDYNAEEITKSDSLWDTNTLFNEAPTIKDEFSLGENITGFYFKGASYLGKEETWVFAAIGLPNQEQYKMPANGYPALILVHGGGGQVYLDWINYWTSKGFIALALDMFSNALDENGKKIVNPNGGPGEHDGMNFDDPDNVNDSWTYHSVRNVIISHNILLNRDDVNSKQTGIVGISWGSVVTEVVSGIDKRFASFAPVYGAGYIYEDQAWIARGGTFLDENKKDNWIAKFDPSSYLSYSTKPMLFVSGVNDPYFSFESRYKSYQLPKGKVFYSQRNDLTHDNSWNKTYEIYAFFLHTLLNQDTLSFINDVEIKKINENVDRIYFSFENRKFYSAQLVYTTSTDSNSHNWHFITQLISINNGWVTMPDDITAFTIEFIHSEINENYHLSTPLYVL